MVEFARFLPTCFEDSMSKLFANYLSRLKKSWRTARFKPWISGFQSRRSPSKLMRLDWGRPEIRSKSYSNRLLIDFFDPNLMLKCIEMVAMIWIQTFMSKIRSISIKNWSKNDYYRPKMTIFEKFDQNFDINGSFSII